MRRGWVVVVVALLALVIVTGVVTLRPAEVGAVLRTVTVGRFPGAMVVDDRTGRAFVANAADGTVSILDTSSGDVVRTVHVGQNAHGLSVDRRTGRVFVLDAARGAVHVLDARSGALLRTTAVGSDPVAIAVDEQSGHVFIVASGGNDNGAIANANGGILSMLDATSGAPVHVYHIATGIFPAAMVVDGQSGRVFVGTLDGAIQVIDARNGTVVTTAHVGPGDQRLTVDPVTRRVFIADGAGTVYMLDARDGAVPRTISTPTAGGAGPAGQVTLAVDTRRDRVFVARDNIVTVLEARRGAIVHTTRLGNAGVSFIAAILAVDEQSDRLFVARPGVWLRCGTTGGAGTVSVLDARDGAILRTVTVGLSPSGIAVDERAGRVFVVNSRGAMALVADAWGWVPSWLRQWLPFLPAPASQPCRSIGWWMLQGPGRTIRVYPPGARSTVLPITPLRLVPVQGGFMMRLPARSSVADGTVSILDATR